jgi:hypothetical protein
MDHVSPPRASHAMAMVQVTIFEAINGIANKFKPYHVTSKPASDAASPVAAAATAAHSLLVELSPTQVGKFNTQLALSLVGIPNGSISSCIEWGAVCANKMVTMRSNDNSMLEVPYVQSSDPGDWMPTSMQNKSPLLPHWPLVIPFALSSGSSPHPQGPPNLTSPEYTAAFNEVKELGGLNSSTRTAKQKKIALFWADGAGTEMPPGHWMRIATDIVEARGLSTMERARLFALLELGVADAAIVSWDAKYALNHWPPVTGIQGALTNGNLDTVKDAGWLPLIDTPPFPAYTSGHSTFSSTAAQILARVLGDDIAFSTTLQCLPNVMRTFTNFSTAAAECGTSRIYGAIHWQYDNVDALTNGMQIGDFVVDGFLKHIGDPNNGLFL